MIEKFTKIFLTNVLLVVGGGFMLWLILYAALESESAFFWQLFIISVPTAAAYMTYNDAINESKREANQELNKIKSQLEGTSKELLVLKNSEEVWKSTIAERSSGFPTLLTLIDQYVQLRDEYAAGTLIHRKNPAVKSAELVKVETQRRRMAEFNLKKTMALIEYYESIAPFLVDLKDDIVESAEEEYIFGDYTPAESYDPTTLYVTKEEYRNLAPQERNQRALDRFWKRPNKSKRLIGLLYERYIGHLYECRGYDVRYAGAQDGLKDLGRDLICKKAGDTILIQCKYWAHFKTIHEKHIFQLFGSVFQMRNKNPELKIKAIFITSTSISDLAKDFANELDIEVVEGFKFDNDYPSIKCNISKNGEKIYHLPFDQQYDNVKIISKQGEFYCKTVADAERAGFRRALRWQGTRKA